VKLQNHAAKWNGDMQKGIAAMAEELRNQSRA